jgi:polyvinyl alcohol dehydrogenase (cytochrome)
MGEQAIVVRALRKRFRTKETDAGIGLETGLLLMASMLVAVLGAWSSGPAVSIPESAGSGWPTAGYDIGNTRDAASEHVIGPGDASRLKPAWSITTAGNIKITPTVYDGVVYYPDLGGNLLAVSARSGRVLWSRTIASYTGLANDVSRVSPAVYGDELVLGDSDYLDYSGAWVFGVNKDTGRLLWRTRVDDHLAAIITSSPVVYHGIAYLGVSSFEEGMTLIQPGYRCCTFRGSVVALDAATGRLLWKTYTILAGAGYSGAAVWGSTPAIDPRDHLLYVGTGNNYSAPPGVCQEPGQTGCTPPPADDHVDSILALDMATGTIRWYVATLSSDVTISACTRPGVTCGPDFDFGSGPNLIRLPSGRQLVGIGQKSGVYWALNPRTGAVVWHTQVGPGSVYGGIQWGSATDGRHVFVAIGNLYGESYPITSASGQVTTTSGGSWAALDAATGKILWQVADPQQAADIGYVSTANGLVFAGSTADTGNDMFALNATDGRILWSFSSGRGSPVVSGAAVAGNTVYWGSGNEFATRCPNGQGGIRGCTLLTPNGKLFAFRIR